MPNCEVCETICGAEHATQCNLLAPIIGLTNMEAVIKQITNKASSFAPLTMRGNDVSKKHEAIQGHVCKSDQADRIPKETISPYMAAIQKNNVPVNVYKHG